MRTRWSLWCRRRATSICPANGHLRDSVGPRTSTWGAAWCVKIWCSFGTSSLASRWSCRIGCTIRPCPCSWRRGTFGQPTWMMMVCERKKMLDKGLQRCSNSIYNAGLLIRCLVRLEDIHGYSPAGYQVPADVTGPFRPGRSTQSTSAAKSSICQLFVPEYPAISYGVNMDAEHLSEHFDPVFVNDVTR